MTAVAKPVHSGNLRWLSDTYNQTQKLRVSLGNRIDAVERGADEAPISSTLKELYDSLNEHEGFLVKDMTDELESHPVYGPWLSKVKGIGPVLACKLLGQIDDISTFITVSKLWRFAGYAVIEGRREYPKAGEKLHYSIRLKSTVYLASTSFLKCDSLYAVIYNKERMRLLIRETGANESTCRKWMIAIKRANKMKGDKDAVEAGKDAKKAINEHVKDRMVTVERDDAEGNPIEVERKAWSLGHQHSAAIRKMSKIFLQNLWQAWREAEHLPIRKLYVEEKLGHTGIIDPWEMVEGD